MQSIPVIWINLKRAHSRRKAMEWALTKGGWNHTRVEAIDGQDKKNRFLTIPDLLTAGSQLPGVQRWEEPTPFRRTSRAELACMASWQIAFRVCQQRSEQWFLVMEDDVGASLAIPEEWPFSLSEIIAASPPDTLAIQLAPINPNVRSRLYEYWASSERQALTVRKSEIRSHGNGAVLLNHTAIKFLSKRFSQNCHSRYYHSHIIYHPWSIRPVADKVLYGYLPKRCSSVLTFPLFCLDSQDSDIHSLHVSQYHTGSRENTQKLWEKEGLISFVNAQKYWDKLRDSPCQ